jgi:hypothetical protein
MYRASATLVLASCMSEWTPSNIRAPPDDDTTIRGISSDAATSMVRATFSPTTLPIDPPMNRKSMAARATRRPARFPTPLRTASPSPVFLRAAARRSP